MKCYKLWRCVRLGEAKEDIDQMVACSIPKTYWKLMDSEVDSEDVYQANLYGVTMETMEELGYQFSDDMVLYGADMDIIAPKETLRELGLL